LESQSQLEHYIILFPATSSGHFLAKRPQFYHVRDFAGLIHVA